MLGLRYYACVACDAVHADVDAPPACGRCGRSDADAFDEVTASFRDGSYFAPYAGD